ncbi:MAG: kinase [Eubacteriales bacterium]|nr:kinase [Eubacteriales bacterium]
MRLKKIQDFLTQRQMAYTYWEENDCGSITFLHRGLSYHVWEYPAPDRGAESNVRTTGRSEDFDGDYEERILEILRTW